MKRVLKSLGLFIFIFYFLTLLPGQTQTREKKFNIELGLNFGSTLGYSITESTYSDSWSTLWIDINESGEIFPELSKPMVIGGNISLITQKGIGVQFNLDYNFNADVAGTSTYEANGSDWWGPINESVEWENEGTVKMMVLNLNFIYKMQSKMVCPWFTGGVSYYSGNIEVSSNSGFGYEDWAGDFEYIGPRLGIDESLSGVGFNVGAGLDVHFTPNVAFSVEARYYIIKKHELNWETQTGTYSNYIWGGSIDLTQAGADYMDELIEPFEFNPSFLKLAAGFKFIF